MHITPAHISLDRPPGDKIAAIAQAAAMLVDNGCVEDGFRYGMIAREAMGNTYLGHGIAVPHGVPQTERYIVKNGAVFIRTESGGIPWGPQAEKVDTVIAVAARQDDYLRFLRRLSRVMNTPEHLAVLKESGDVDAIIALFGGDDDLSDSKPENAADATGAHSQTISFPHPAGLHIHPASTLSELAKTLDADVRLTTADGKSADAQNTAGLLSLGITHGQALTVSANRPEAVSAVIAHIRRDAPPPEEALLPPEMRRKPGKLPWMIAGGAALLALLLYLLIN